MTRSRASSKHIRLRADNRALTQQDQVYDQKGLSRMNMTMFPAETMDDAAAERTADDLTDEDKEHPKRKKVTAAQIPDLPPALWAEAKKRVLETVKKLKSTPTSPFAKLFEDADIYEDNKKALDAWKPFEPLTLRIEGDKYWKYWLKEDSNQYVGQEYERKTDNPIGKPIEFIYVPLGSPQGRAEAAETLKDYFYREYLADRLDYTTDEVYAAAKALGERIIDVHKNGNIFAFIEVPVDLTGWRYADKVPEDHKKTVRINIYSRATDSTGEPNAGYYQHPGIVAVGYCSDFSYQEILNTLRHELLHWVQYNLAPKKSKDGTPVPLFGYPMGKFVNWREHLDYRRSQSPEGSSQSTEDLAELHKLRDVEFYTNLASDVERFFTEYGTGLRGADLRDAIRAYIAEHRKPEHNTFDFPYAGGSVPPSEYYQRRKPKKPGQKGKQLHSDKFFFEVRPEVKRRKYLIAFIREIEKALGESSGLSGGFMTTVPEEYLQEPSVATGKEPLSSSSIYSKLREVRSDAQKEQLAAERAAQEKQLAAERAAQEKELAKAKSELEQRISSLKDLFESAQNEPARTGIFSGPEEAPDDNGTTVKGVMITILRGRESPNEVYWSYGTVFLQLIHRETPVDDCMYAVFTAYFDRDGDDETYKNFEDEESALNYFNLLIKHYLKEADSAYALIDELGADIEVLERKLEYLLSSTRTASAESAPDDQASDATGDEHIAGALTRKPDGEPRAHGDPMLSDPQGRVLTDVLPNLDTFAPSRNPGTGAYENTHGFENKSAALHREAQVEFEGNVYDIRTEVAAVGEDYTTLRATASAGGSPEAEILYSYLTDNSLRLNKVAGTDALYPLLWHLSEKGIAFDNLDEALQSKQAEALLEVADQPWFDDLRSNADISTGFVVKAYRTQEAKEEAEAAASYRTAGFDVEAQMAGVKLYHGTSSAFLPSIFAKGFIMGKKNGENHVFFTSDFEKAASYGYLAALGRGGGGGPVVVESYLSKPRRVKRLEYDPFDRHIEWDEMGRGEDEPEVEFAREYLEEGWEKILDAVKRYGAEAPVKVDGSDELEKVHGVNLYKASLAALGSLQPAQDRSVLVRLVRQAYPPGEFGYLHVRDDGSLALTEDWYRSREQLRIEGDQPRQIIKRVWVRSSDYPDVVGETVRAGASELPQATKQRISWGSESARKIVQDAKSLQVEIESSVPSSGIEPDGQLRFEFMETDTALHKSLRKLAYSLMELANSLSEGLGEYIHPQDIKTLNQYSRLMLGRLDAKLDESALAAFTDILEEVIRYSEGLEDELLSQHGTVQTTPKEEWVAIPVAEAQKLFSEATSEQGEDETDLDTGRIANRVIQASESEMTPEERKALERVRQIVMADRERYPRPAGLSPAYRSLASNPPPHPTYGYCSVAADLLYDMLGGAKAGYELRVGSEKDAEGKTIPGSTHWWVQRGDIRLDPTAEQFTAIGRTPPYEGSKRKAPSSLRHPKRLDRPSNRVEKMLKGLEHLLDNDLDKDADAGSSLRELDRGHRDGQPGLTMSKLDMSPEHEKHTNSQLFDMGRSAKRLAQASTLTVYHGSEACDLREAEDFELSSAGRHGYFGSGLYTTPEFDEAAFYGHCVYEFEFTGQLFSEVEPVDRGGSTTGRLGDVEHFSFTVKNARYVSWSVADDAEAEEASFMDRLSEKYGNLVYVIGGDSDSYADVELALSRPSDMASILEWLDDPEENTDGYTRETLESFIRDFNNFSPSSAKEEVYDEIEPDDIGGIVESAGYDAVEIPGLERNQGHTEILVFNPEKSLRLVRLHDTKTGKVIELDTSSPSTDADDALLGRSAKRLAQAEVDALPSGHQQTSHRTAAYRPIEIREIKDLCNEGVLNSERLENVKDLEEMAVLIKNKQLIVHNLRKLTNYLLGIVRADRGSHGARGQSLIPNYSEEDLEDIENYRVDINEAISAYAYLPSLLDGPNLASQIIVEFFRAAYARRASYILLALNRVQEGLIGLMDYAAEFDMVPSVPSMDTQQIEMEGFRVTVRNMEDVTDYIDPGYALPAARERLKLYREKLQSVAPRALRNHPPIILECGLMTYQKGVVGIYEDGPHVITLSLPFMLQTDADNCVRLMVHELGHHIFRTMLSRKASSDWTYVMRTSRDIMTLADMIKKLQDLSRLHPKSRVMDVDPVFYLQLQSRSLKQELGIEKYTPEELLSALQRLGPDYEISLKQYPVTPYGHKNPEEAFCEALGMYVGYGPMTVLPEVREFINTYMSSEIRLASKDAHPTREYTIGEARNEAGEYFENSFAKTLAPGLFQDLHDALGRIEAAETRVLTHEELLDLINSDVGDVANEPDRDARVAMVEELMLKQMREADLKSLQQAFSEGEPVPPPVVLEDLDGELALLGGNSRLAIATSMDISLPVKVISYEGHFKLPEASEEEEYA